MEEAICAEQAKFLTILLSFSVSNRLVTFDPLRIPSVGLVTAAQYRQKVTAGPDRQHRFRLAC